MQKESPGGKTGSTSASGRASPELLEKIRSSVNIIDVVGEHVVLRKGGANHMGLCPFHGDRSPSFTVSEKKQFFHCFGCKKGGDVFNFVQEILGVSFRESVEELAERGRVRMPGDWTRNAADPEAQVRRAQDQEKIKTAARLNRFVAAFYRAQLSPAQHPRAESYVRGRGVKQEWGQHFYIGAAPKEWDALARHLVEKKAPLDLAVELGLIKKSTRPSGKPGDPGYFDLFRDRVLFPIMDIRGRVTGFGGRILPDSKSLIEVDPGGLPPPPKYLNSPESLLFQKSRLVFGLYQAQKHIREADAVILVEGYFDVVALHAAGFQNAVALCGTSLTQEHLRQLRRLASKIILLLDSDEAGIRATLKSMEIGLEAGQVLYGARLPSDAEGTDPDELLFDGETGELKPEGVTAMKALVESARPVLDEHIEIECDLALRPISEGGGAEAVSQALKRMGGWLGHFQGDRVGVELRVQRIAERLKISREMVYQSIKGSLQQHGGVAVAKTPTAAPPRSTPAPRTQARPLRGAEKVLLGSLFRREPEILALWAKARERLPRGAHLRDLFESAEIREWVSQIGGAESALIPSGIPPSIQECISESAMAENPLWDSEEVRRAIHLRLNKIWARISQRIQGEMTQAELTGDAVQQSELMKEFLDVQRKMKELSKFYDQV